MWSVDVIFSSSSMGGGGVSISHVINNIIVKCRTYGFEITFEYVLCVC